MLKSKFMALSCFALLSVGLQADDIHWGYGSENGPKKWGDLDKNFALCKTGKSQTPINIVDTQTKKTKHQVTFEYGNNTQDIVNNGHSVQVNVKDGSVLKFNNTSYELVQFHLHTPSENQINGVSYPLEVHLVHKNAAGKLLVVGVLFKEGADNKVLAKIAKSMPKAVNKPAKFQGFAVSDLLPENKAYYEFVGSLTTPPCSENVQWVVMKTQPEVSKKQISQFQAVLHSNARDIQPLNKRVVKSAE